MFFPRFLIGAPNINQQNSGDFMGVFLGFHEILIAKLANITSISGIYRLKVKDHASTGGYRNFAFNFFYKSFAS